MFLFCCSPNFIPRLADEVNRATMKQKKNADRNIVQNNIFESQ